MPSFPAYLVLFATDSAGVGVASFVAAGRAMVREEA